MSTKFLETILLDPKRGGIWVPRRAKAVATTCSNTPTTRRLRKSFASSTAPLHFPCVSLHFYERCHDCNEAVCGLNRLMAGT